MPPDNPTTTPSAPADATVSAINDAARRAADRAYPRWLYAGFLLVGLVPDRIAQGSARDLARRGRKGVRAMKHLRVANGSALAVPVARRSVSDICLVDYSHCPVGDTCWLMDFDTGCDTSDSCIIDLQ